MGGACVGDVGETVGTLLGEFYGYERSANTGLDGSRPSPLISRYIVIVRQLEEDFLDVVTS